MKGNTFESDIQIDDYTYHTGDYVNDATDIYASIEPVDERSKCDRRRYVSFTNFQIIFEHFMKNTYQAHIGNKTGICMLPIAKSMLDYIQCEIQT